MNLSYEELLDLKKWILDKLDIYDRDYRMMFNLFSRYVEYSDIKEEAQNQYKETYKIEYDKLILKRAVFIQQLNYINSDIKKYEDVMKKN